MKLVGFCLALAFAAASASNEIYAGYKVYTIPVKDQATLDNLRWLDENSEAFGADFWSLHTNIGSEADLMVKPETQTLVEGYFAAKNVDFSTKFNDLKEYYDENDREARSPRRLGKAMSGSLDLSRYYSYPEIEEYIYRLARNYPQLVEIEMIGQSYENRNIYLVDVCKDDNKPVIFIDANIHAREWIAPASALYLLSQIVEVGNLTYLCDSVSFKVIPSINPDGYDFSLRSDRNWRKTRRPSGNGCVGTDGNRNFGYEWGGPGASTNPCSDTYRGSSAFSESETQVVRDALIRFAPKIKFYLTIHSYGRYILYPWGYAYALPENYRDIDRIAQAGAAAANRLNGARYSVGGSANVLYTAAGGSDDHALGAHGIPISITFECPGNSFTPPASQIQSLVVETSTAIVAMFDEFVVWNREQMAK